MSIVPQFLKRKSSRNIEGTEALGLNRIIRVKRINEELKINLCWVKEG